MKAPSPGCTYAERLLAVLPVYGIKTIRRAGFDAGLSDPVAMGAAKELLRVGAIETAVGPWLGSAVSLTEEGRALQEQAIMARMAGEAGHKKRGEGGSR